MTTIMQPLQCDLQIVFKKRIELRTQEQPLVAEHRRGTNSVMKRPQPQPPHTRGRFRAPASSPTQAPCNIHAAINITMRFAAFRG